MAQDIRELFKQNQEPEIKQVPEGHSNRFRERLEQRLPKKQSSRHFWIYRMAAVFVVTIGITAFLLFSANSIGSGVEIVDGADKQEEQTREQVEAVQKSQPTLADISPQFKKVEEYYLANLNLGLSKLEVTGENKALIDSFMAQLAELDKEYGRLNNELREHGFSGDTVEARIQNLQFRLELMYKLNSKLNELKHNRNEDHNQIQA